MADLGEQLQIQKQIQQLLQDRESLLSREKDLINDQIKVTQKLCKVLQKCKPPVKDIDQMSRSLNSASKSTGRFSERLEDAAERAGELKEKADGVASKIKSIAMAGGGLLGLSSIFNKVTAMAGGLFSALTSVAGAIFDIGLSILTIPLKVFSGIVEMAGAGGGGGNPLRQAMEDIRKEFGSLASNEGKAVVSTLKQFTKNMKNIAGTGLRFHQLFAYGLQGMADVLKHNQELAVALKNSFNSMLKEFETSATVFYAVGKGLGHTADQQAALMKRSKRAGRDVVKDQLSMANMAIQMGRRFETSSKMIGKAFGQMAENADQFGHLSIEQMGAVATFAIKLGIEIKELGSIIDKFLNFDEAAKGASQLATGLGIMVDSLKMTNAAAAGDGAMIVSTLQDSFRQAGKTYDELTFAQRRLVQQTTGMGEAAAQAAFGTKGLKTNYNDMTKAAGKANDEQLDTNEIMREMAKNIERLVRSGGGAGFKGFFDAFVKGFERGVRYSKPFFKMLRTIRKALRMTFKMGRQVGRMFIETFPGIKSMVTGLTEIFNPRRFKSFLNDIKDAFQEFFNVLAGPNANQGVKGFLENLKRAFEKWLTGGSGGGQKIMDGFKVFMKAVKAILLGLAPLMVQGLTWVFTQIRNFLQDPSAAGDFFGVIGDVVVLFFQELYAAIKPFLPALESVTKELGKIIGDSFAEAYNYLEPRIIKFGEDLFNALWSTWYGKLFVVAMIAKIFAPLILIIVGLGSMLVKAVVGVGSGLLSLFSSGQDAPDSLGQNLDQLSQGNRATAALKGAAAMGLLILAVGAALTGIIWAMGQGEGLTTESVKAFFLLAGGMVLGGAAIMYAINANQTALNSATLKKAIPIIAALGLVMYGLTAMTESFLESISEVSGSGISVGMVDAATDLMVSLVGSTIAVVVAAAGIAKVLTLGGPLMAIFGGAVLAVVLYGINEMMEAMTETLTDVLDNISGFLSGGDESTRVSAMQSFANITKALFSGMAEVIPGLVMLGAAKLSSAMGDPVEVMGDIIKAIVEGMSLMYQELQKLKISNPNEFEQKIDIIVKIIQALEPILAIANPIKNLEKANLEEVRKLVCAQGEVIPALLEAITTFLGNIVEHVQSFNTGDIRRAAAVAELLTSFATLLDSITGPMETALSRVTDNVLFFFETGPSEETLAGVAQKMQARTSGLINAILPNLSLILQTMSRAGIGSGEKGMAPAQIEKRFKVFNTMLKAYSTLMRLATDAMGMFGDDFTEIEKDIVARGVAAVVAPDADRSLGFKMASILGDFIENLGKKMGATFQIFVQQLNPAIAELAKLGKPEEAKAKISLLSDSLKIFSTMARMLSVAREYLPKEFDFSKTDATKLATMLGTITQGLGGGVGKAIEEAAKGVGEALKAESVKNLVGKEAEIKGLGEMLGLMTKFSGIMQESFKAMGVSAGGDLSEEKLEEIAGDLARVMRIFTTGVLKNGLEQFGLLLERTKIFGRDNSGKLKNFTNLLEGFNTMTSAIGTLRGSLGEGEVAAIRTDLQAKIGLVTSMLVPQNETTGPTLHTLATTLTKNKIPFVPTARKRAVDRLVPFLESFQALVHQVNRIGSPENISVQVEKIIKEAQEVAAILNRTTSLGFETALDNFASAVATGTGSKTYEIDPGRFNLNLTVEVKLGKQEMVGYLSGQAANPSSRLQQKPQ